MDTNGFKQFELSLVPSSDSYRAFRFPWNGVVAAPYLIVEPQVDNITLIFNKFGDTNVAYYRIYGGTSPQPTTLVAESASTFRQLTNLPETVYYFRVTAVRADSVESPFSNEESVDVNFTQPGQNLVHNGDFSGGSSSWSFNVSAPASADWAIGDGVSQFYITNGGPSLASVQMRQGSVPLIQGDQYVLSFDAWSSQSRYVQVQVAQSVSPFIDYSALTATFLTPNRASYRYVFTMKNPSDFSASLQFNLGSAAGAVSLAKVFFFRLSPFDLNMDGRADLQDLSIFCGNWLKKQNGLPGDLDSNGNVNFYDFGLLCPNLSIEGP